MKEQKLPFLYGVQYYRAPEPPQKCWKKDLEQVKKSGFNTVKYWVQWRWSEPAEETYRWDDLDELMELAEQNGLRVILNLILDVMPVWAERNYQETRMVDRFLQPIPTQTTVCRQIGGYPGPCHRNPVMREKRERFTRAAITHFRKYPALWAWDVWNEPERDLVRRAPNHFPELCYCQVCRSSFQKWLERKYRTIENLNEVWGQCWNRFDEIEPPQDAGTIHDFIDWREFQLEGLNDDAQWRLQAVHELDPERHPHLHVVPDAGCFSAVTCVDDFALGRQSEIFGSSMVNNPYLCAQAISAANGKYFYNAEWHINYGKNVIYQRIESREHFLFDLLPQLGWGVRGFLYWQYRAEILGLDSPAWGVIRPDGSSRPITEFAKEFPAKFAPYLEVFMRSRPAESQVLIYRSCRNEIYQFCRHKNLDRYNDTLRNYSQTLYALNIPFGFADEETLRRNEHHVKLLILPQVYYATQEEADLFDQFVKAGGIILSEGNLAAYSSSTGRFCEEVPGSGLAARWELRESEITSSFHLPTGPAKINKDADGDMLKALEADGGSQGGEFFPLELEDGTNGYGAIDFAILEGSGCKTILSFRSIPCGVRKHIGAGELFYIGTMLGFGAEKGDALLRTFVAAAADAAGIPHNPINRRLHTDYLTTQEGENSLIICTNPGNEIEPFTPPAEGRWKELFGRPFKEVPPKSSLLLVKEN